MDGLQRAEQVVLDDVGHEAFIEDPDATFAALTTFLADRAEQPRRPACVLA